MGVFRDLTGHRVGRLTVLGQGARSNTGEIRWACQCDCGGSALLVTDRITGARPTQSCGCLHRERAAARQFKHGGKSTREYGIWKGIKQRCYSPTSPSYRIYGGRGITMCDRWRDSFAAFITDMGAAPSPQHQIDRIDSDGPYAPENCRWATPLEQARNTRRNRVITLHGVTKPLSAWVADAGLPYGTVLARIDRLHWDAETALRTPVHPKQL